MSFWWPPTFLFGPVRKSDTLACGLAGLRTPPPSSTVSHRAIPLAIALAAMAVPAYSGTDIVHVSGFEALEQCGVYDGIGDTIEIESIQLSGTLTLDGGPFPVSPFHRGRVSLRDRRTGDVIALGLTNDQSYTANIVPGSYDVLYDHVDGELVPANLGATLAGDIVLSESGTLDIDVPSAVISGRYRVGGSAPPASPYDSGEIR